MPHSDGSHLQLSGAPYLLKCLRDMLLPTNESAATYLLVSALSYVGGFAMEEIVDIAVPTPVHQVTPPKKVPKPKNAGERKARLQRIFEEFDRLFPTATCALQHGSAWQLLVATILSAQCTDERVNKITPGLFAKYPTVQDFADASQDELANDIRSAGFFNNKAKSIIGAARKILSDYTGEVPKTIEELLTVPGAARKTANVVLGTSYGVAAGVVVDTHVQRISQRLALTKNEDPVKIERDLMAIVPQDRWILFAHQTIHFGRQICIARKPRCANCPLDSLCYSADKTLA